TIFKGEQINIDVLANDTDAENAQLTITAVTAIKGGVPEIINNKVTFVAEEEFTGDAQFSYSISDGAHTAQGLVDITIMLSPADKIIHLKNQVDSFVSHTIAIIDEQQINCVTHPESPQCELVSVKFSDGQFDASKTYQNQTILILDTNLEFSATVRYRSRVKAAFTQGQDGFYHQAQLEAYDPQFHIPKMAKAVLNQIDTFSDDNNNSKFIPATWLDPLSWLSDRLYPFDNYIEYLGHGKTPFLYLLEHNPKAEFVIATPPDFFKIYSGLFCRAELIEEGQADSNLERLRSLVISAANDFKKQVLDEQGIEYINYSGGHTLESVKTRWSQLCVEPEPDINTLVKLLDVYRPFYDVLFNSDNIFSAQASDVNMTSTNNVLDIDKSFKNKILVGDFAILDSKLPIDGKLENVMAPELLINRDNSKHWVDLFINFGVKSRVANKTPLMDTDALGLASYPISSMQPSWAAPVALSWAINIKNSHFPDDALDNNIIEQIKDKMTPELCSYSNWDISSYYGKCKMQDPLLHRQHEVYRLGYLD
ncbi:Ig-like domain-containing protein, partial [Pseudoalteromonas denitrificans]